MKQILDILKVANFFTFLVWNLRAPAQYTNFRFFCYYLQKRKNTAVLLNGFWLFIVTMKLILLLEKFRGLGLKKQFKIQIYINQNWIIIHIFTCATPLASEWCDGIVGEKSFLNSDGRPWDVGEECNVWPVDVFWN